MVRDWRVMSGELRQEDVAIVNGAAGPVEDKTSRPTKERKPTTDQLNMSFVLGLMTGLSMRND